MVRTVIVVVKKKGTEFRPLAVLVPNFGYLREIVMSVPVRSDSPSVRKRNGGDMARFSEETGNHVLLCAAWSFQFWGRGLVRKQPDR